MKKQIILFVMLFAGLTLMAKPVDPDRAVRVARNFVAQYVKGADQLTATVVYTHTMPKSGQPAMYVVNIGNMFVLVAADDIAHPVLGYSLSRPWPTKSGEWKAESGERADAGIKLPAQVTGYLDDLAGQIAAGVEAGVAPDGETAAEWQRLANFNSQFSTFNLPDSVGPLLTTTWDQGQYYNALCPEDPAGPDGHALTGCVATAMAQIINYWGYPVHGRGTHSYNVSGLDAGSFYGHVNTIGYGTQYVNFDSANYDYANMPDALASTSTSQEVQAVAQLMYHCGVAVNMLYNSTESGAQEEDVRAALISYYGFAPTLGYAHKQMYTNTEWIDSLRGNINRGEPVFYCGRSIIAAHAFVLDGYKQDDFFHFNFGWSGFGDGWYLLSAINPSYSFNDWQSAIMGIRPDSTTNAVICQRSMDVQNRDVFTVSEPIDLYPLRGGSVYRATNELTGVRINLNLVPEDSLSQLVIDALDFGTEQSVLIYDGLNEDSILRVLETRGYSDRNRIVNWRELNWTYYGLPPSDTVLRQMASMDFSPVVSTRHGFTVVANSYGGLSEGFRLRVSDASDCRMVSNLTATNDISGTWISWTDNGEANQWQIKVGDTIYYSDSTHILLTALAPNTSYTIRVRAVCGENNYSSWNEVDVNKKEYWTEVVTTAPEGYFRDNDTIRISSAEGLAWLAHCVDSLLINGLNDYQFYNSVISIENDINLSDYLWNPIRNWNGNIEGNGYVIRNMNLSTSEYYAGLFATLTNIKLSNIGMQNARVNSINSAGPLVGVIQNCQVSNCYSKNHIVNVGNGQGGGLIGNAWNSQMINCYAYGDIYAQFGYGGLVGYLSNSDIQNCVTQVGETFNWSSNFWFGLIAEEIHGGTFSNCFSDISIAKCNWYSDDPNYLQLAKRAYFLGNVYSVDAIDNLAAFNITTDTMGILMPDTSVNYSLGENMDVITALNTHVADFNSPDIRMWIRDSVTHLPVFGGYYEVTCPNVSNIMAENIPYNDGFAVALSWQENGEANEWQIKYNIKVGSIN